MTTKTNIAQVSVDGDLDVRSAPKVRELVDELIDSGCAGEGGAAADAGEDSFAERGRGIKLMRLLADSVTIGPKTSGSGTVVRLVKMYSAQPAGAERLSSLAG